MEMTLLTSLLLLAAPLAAAVGTGPDQFFHSGETDTLYPINSLLDADGVYPFGGDAPPVRVHHSVALVEEKVVVFGGISTSGALLDDVHIYDTRQQRWTGPVHRRAAANHAGEVIDLLGNHVLLPLVSTDEGDEDVMRLPAAHTGFEGDPPSKRAEHRAVAMGGLMYIFGGRGGENGIFDIQNDLYAFDPIALRWTYLDASSGRAPPRRAGHSMVADASPAPPARSHSEGSFLYVFGGRGETKSGDEPTADVALADVWRYDTSSNHWAQLGSSSTLCPPGRQHAATGMLLDRLFVYGGIDPKSSYIYQDVWAFHTNTQQWQQLYSTSAQRAQWLPTPDTAVPGFAPPPLFSAHLLPIVPDAFLLYGGVGGGGACGDVGACGQQLTTLGQVYRFNVGVTALTADDGPARVTEVVDGRTEDASFSSHNASARLSLGSFTTKTGPYQGLASAAIDPVLCAWNFSRLSGATDTDVGTGAYHSASASADRGRRRKNYALEEVVMSSSGILYEMGGIQAVRGDYLDAGQTAEGLYLPMSLDGGGSLVYKAYDSESGEQLRTVVDPVANGAWHYRDAFTVAMPVPASGSAAAKDVAFVHGLKQHRASERDIVLISGTDVVL